MIATQRFRQEITRIKERQEGQTANDESSHHARVNDDYNGLLHVLIERAKETTCDRCELACIDSYVHMECPDLPMFYCERFCDAYFTEADALDRKDPVERELWAGARMWRAQLLHLPLWVRGRANAAIYS
jgi:hypothetical protein